RSASLQHVEHKYIQQYTFFFAHRSELYARKCSGALDARAGVWVDVTAEHGNVVDAERSLGVNVIFYALQSLHPKHRALQTRAGQAINISGFGIVKRREALQFGEERTQRCPHRGSAVPAH